MKSLQWIVAVYDVLQIIIWLALAVAGVAGTIAGAFVAGWGLLTLSLPTMLTGAVLLGIGLATIAKANSLDDARRAKRRLNDW